MKLVGLVIVIATLGGCTARDRDDAMDQGMVVAQHAADAATAAWVRAVDAAKELTPDSGRAALRSAEDGLEDAERKLAPGKRLEEAKAEVARLRAALDIDRIRHEIDERASDVERLRKELAAAQAAYDAATRRVDSLAASLRG